MKIVRVLFAAVLMFSFTWSGWAASSDQVPDRSLQEKKAEEALEAIKQAYISRDTGRFFSLVSDQPHFNLPDLHTKIDRQFRDFSQIDLNFVIDNTLVTDKKVALITHWQKRAQSTTSGNVQKSEGKADLIFGVKDTASLLSIKGDSPF